jgi:LAGLIDADG endonuclease
MAGENPPGAGNQQERPGIEQWIVGFVDGEGCFSLPIHRNPSMRIGWTVQPRFAVVQGERSAHVLYLIKQHFECGTVYRNRRRDSHREDLLVFGVFNQHALRSSIVPFFEANPLRTAKADEFKKFAAVLRMMEARVHLTGEGLTEIAKIAQTMNHRKPSRFLESPEAIRQPTLLDGKSRRYGPDLMAT